jgi:2-succinyl-6-hydroxy-2,4-cyclohexadiene-1-carboxylate synthase
VQKKKYQFNYVLAGDPGRPVLVLLHGFLGSIADWHQLMLWFNESFYCLAIDLPGHGQTRVDGNESCYTVPECAGGIIKLLDDLKIERANLLGYSMGGRLALYLTVSYPDRWLKLIIESASPGLPAGSEKKDRWRDDQKLAIELEQGDIQKFITSWYEQPVFTSLHHHPQFAEMHKNRVHNDPFELARSLRGMSAGRQESLWNKLSEIPLPILMLAGEYDQKYKKIGTAMKQRCPTLELKVVENCGHMIHFENPQLYAHYVRQFLEAPYHSQGG